MAKKSLGGSGIGGSGIGGSGIFGFFGTTINCNASEKSMYCDIMKLFNLLIVALIVGYLGYIFYNYMKKSKGSR